MGTFRFSCILGRQVIAINEPSWQITISKEKDFGNGCSDELPLRTIPPVQVRAKAPTGNQTKFLLCLPIGDQEWTRFNLSVTHFRNGEEIPHVTNEDEWTKASEEGLPAWCHFGNDETNDEAYGKLYNWYAVSDPRGLAPEGWRIPSENEWLHLSELLGGDEEAAHEMRSEHGWNDDAQGRGRRRVCRSSGW